MKKLLALAATAALSTVVLAAAGQKLSFDVVGAYWGGCAGKLTAALGEGGLKAEGKLKAVQEKTQRVVAEVADDADLGAAAKTISGCDTPHKDKCPPGLSLVLFAKLDKDSAKGAEEAVGKVKGVDGKGSKADAEKGEVSIKLDGKAKVTVADLTKALDGAGIKASIKK